MKKLLHIIALISTACSLGCLGLFLLIFASPSDTRIAEQTHSPYIHTENREYISSITEIAVTNDNLFLLFGHIGIVKQYTLDGEYVCTFAFDFYEKGRARIWSADDALIVQDRDRSIFLLKNENTSEHYDIKSDRQSITNLLNIYPKPSTQTTITQTNDSNISYTLHGNNVLKTQNGVTTELISRPFYTSLFRETNSVIMIISMIITVVSIFAIKKKYNINS